MSHHSILDRLWGQAGLTSQHCLACDVCCRFASPTASFVPFFTGAEAADCGLRIADRGLAKEGAASPEPGIRPIVEPDGQWWRCPLRAATSQACTVYERRPLDCRLYPFVLMFDEAGREVWLGLDDACPLALPIADCRLPIPEIRDQKSEIRNQTMPAWQQAVDEVAALLEGPLADTIAAAPGIVSSQQDHVRLLRLLPEITRRICRSDLGLARLVSTCRGELRGFFSARPTCLTGHTFPAIYLWADLFNLHWKVEADCLLLFAESDGVSFLIAPPLGKGDVSKALNVAAEIMAAVNGPRRGARAQEVDDDLLPAFAAEGWQMGHRAQEYICETASLVELRGRHFDGRRHDIRRFEKLCPGAVWRPYAPADFPQCAALLRRWQRERAGAHPDPLYRDQLEATASLHLRALREAEQLGMAGYVVEAGDEWMNGGLDECQDEGIIQSSNHPSIRSSTSPIVAYTFGFPLADGETFADFLEVADLTYPGLAAWTFHRLCREARAYPRLNLGTDSELPDLARSKLACRPTRIVSSYILNAPE